MKQFMQKNNKDDVVQLRSLRHHKSPSLLSYKSQKAFKVQPGEIQNSKPFRRRQENIVNTNKLNKNNFYTQDIGKLIINTSFGSNPDLQKILSSSPRNFQSNDNCQDANAESKPNIRTTQAKLIRQNKSMSNFEKIAEMTKLPSPRTMGVVQNVINSNQCICDFQTGQILRQKIEKLENENKELWAKNKKLQERVQKCSIELSGKDKKIAEYTNQIKLKKEEIEQQKQINKCLEDIIAQLNCKIEVMIQERQNSLVTKYIQGDEQPGRGEVGVEAREQELLKQISELKQKIYGLNRIVSGYELQAMSIKKLRYELQKEKTSSRCLQKQNKGLKQKMLSMMSTMKSNRVGQSKVGVRKQLDYSISFDLER